MYRKVLSEEGPESESIGLADGTQVHLMGDRSADKVLLFFHGNYFFQVESLETENPLLTQSNRRWLCYAGG